MVCPYETVESVHERLRADWAGVPDIHATDAVQVLLILDDSRGVVSSVTFSRTKVDFCSEGRLWEVMSTDAELRVLDAGTPRLVVAPG